MEVHEVLVRALKEVNEANIPPELQAVAFGKAVDMLTASARGPIEPVQQLRRDLAGDGQAVADVSPLERIASRLRLDIRVVEDVFLHDEQGLSIIVSSKKLEKGIGPATKQLALLVAAGRQAAGLDGEDWTNIAEIRRVCQEYKKLDTANFAAHIKAMKDEFNVRGSGQKRLVKVTRPGWDAARELVERLAGAE